MSRFISPNLGRQDDANPRWDLTPRDEMALSALQGLMAGWSPPTGTDLQSRNLVAAQARGLARAAYAAASEYMREKFRVDEQIKSDIRARVDLLGQHTEHEMYSYWYVGNPQRVDRERIEAANLHALFSPKVWVEQSGITAFRHEHAAALPPESHEPSSEE